MIIVASAATSVLHMQPFLCMLLLLTVIASSAEAVRENPVVKVVQLLSALEERISFEGRAEAKIYNQFEAWCTGRSTNLKLEELQSAVAKSPQAQLDLNVATESRKKEHSEFTALEAQLRDALGTVDRALDVFDQEMAQKGALLQKKVDTADVQAVIRNLNEVLNSFTLTDRDRKNLITLVQENWHDDDGDSLSVMDILEDMRWEAEEGLAEARRAESSAQHKFSILATQSEKLANAETVINNITSSCRRAAKDHGISMRGRAEELNAVVKARKIIVESTGGAQNEMYSLLDTHQSSSITVAEKTVKSSSVAVAEKTVEAAKSFPVVNMHSQLQIQSDPRSTELVTMLRRLAREQHSLALAQLASHVSAVARHASIGGVDSLIKVKESVNQLISKLEAEASIDSNLTMSCHQEMKKTADRKAALQAHIDKLISKIDKAAAESVKLEENVAETRTELAKLAKAQEEMDTVRQDEHTAFGKSRDNLEQGITGLQEALLVLRDFYDLSSLSQDEPQMLAVHSKAQGAGSSIIEILEIVSSDFSKSLAEETAAEKEAESIYEKTTEENKITKSMKEQDVKYMIAEAASLDTLTAESASDREDLQNELSIVLEYEDKLVERCAAEPATYMERKRHLEVEIAGLKQAVAYIDSDAFVQKKARSSRHLRSTPVH